jgi:hypothetical protein
MVEPTRRTAAVALAVLLATGLAACGDDGGAAPDGEPGDTAVIEPVDLPDEAQPYVEALTGTFTGDETLPIRDDQARCIASRVVQVIRLERFAAAGLDPEDLAADELGFDELELDEEDGLKLADAFQQCGVDLYDALADSLTRGTLDPATARRCFEATVSRDQVRRAMAASMIGEEDVAVADSPESEALFEALFTCSGGDEDDLDG